MTWLNITAGSGKVKWFFFMVAFSFLICFAEE